MLAYVFHPLAETELDEAVGYRRPFNLAKAWNSRAESTRPSISSAFIQKRTLSHAAPCAQLSCSRPRVGVTPCTIGSRNLLSASWPSHTTSVSRSIGSVGADQPNQALNRTSRVNGYQKSHT